MPIIRCTNCEKMEDIDYNDSGYINDEPYCAKCYTELTAEDEVAAEEDWTRNEGNLPPAKDWQAWTEQEMTEWISYANKLLRMIPFSNSKWNDISTRKDRVKEYRDKKFPRTKKAEESSNTSNPDLERAVDAWLTREIAESYSYSTRSLAYKFMRENKEFEGVDLDTLRNAIAKKNNILMAKECDGGGFGGLMGVGSAVTSTGAVDVISSPVLAKPKAKRTNLKRKNSKEETQVSPQKNLKMPIIGADGILGVATEGDEGLGDCFVQAWENFFSRQSENPKLVHAIITGQGKIEGLKYNHAWIEIGDSVIDTTIPIFKDGINKEIYYRLARIEKDLIFKYNRDEVLSNATKHKTYGPWETILWEYK